MTDYQIIDQLIQQRNVPRHDKTWWSCRLGTGGGAGKALAVGASTYILRLQVPPDLAQLWLLSPDRRRPSELWIDAQLMICSRPGLWVPQWLLEATQIYAAGHDRAHLTGWLIGREVRVLGRVLDMGEGIRAWRVEPAHLRPMAELKSMTLNAFHSNDQRLTNIHI